MTLRAARLTLSCKASVPRMLSLSTVSLGLDGRRRVNPRLGTPTRALFEEQRIE